MNEFKRKIIAISSAVLPDKLDIKLKYYLKTGRKLDLNNPKTYNEKIQWYKLNYRVPLMTQCADKVRVRQYVESCGLSKILTEQYGIYESPYEIDFDNLPNECFIKCNHNSAGNYHWKRENNPNIEDIKRKFSRMLSINQFALSREWAYKNIRPLIICEEFLRASSSEEFIDFNFFCFNGEPELVMYNLELCAENGDHADGKRAVFNKDFKPVDMTTSVEVLPYDSIKKPPNYDEMLEYARVLSKPFPHVRVDFFLVDGVIHFGELTFYSGSGYGEFYPECWQDIMGDWFVLPDKVIV